MIDSIFIPRGGDFRNEIVWCYKGGGASQKDFGRRHDTIFRYSKSKNYLFYPDNVRVPYESEAAMRENDTAWGKHKGTSKIYHPNPMGKIPEDWWNIKVINSQAKERLGYPTQKPEALLERIIKASSNEGDVVFDAYCGCGTTVAVAERLNRKWIGIDITYQSISLILKRLEDTFGKDFKQSTDNKELSIADRKISLNGIPQDMNAAIELANRQDDRTRKEFEKWSVLTYSNNRAIINEKKGGDGGIDGIAFISDYNEDKKIIQKEVLFSVKSSKALAPSVIRDLYGTLERENATIGVLITLYPMDNLVKEANKYGTYKNTLFGMEYPKIQIVTIDEMLKGRRIQLPAVQEVLKSAEHKGKTKQTVL